jgi:hypothetical protein
MRELDDITGNIVDASLRIHRALGPGLLESVYEARRGRLKAEPNQGVRWGKGSASSSVTTPGSPAGRMRRKK